MKMSNSFYLLLHFQTILSLPFLAPLLEFELKKLKQWLHLISFVPLLLKHNVLVHGKYSVTIYEINSI